MQTNRETKWHSGEKKSEIISTFFYRVSFMFTFSFQLLEVIRKTIFSQLLCFCKMCIDFLSPRSVSKVSSSRSRTFLFL